MPLRDHFRPPLGTRNPPSMYAVTCRVRRVEQHSKLDTWVYPLVVGQPLPNLPVWLSDELPVSLELEAS